MLKMFLTQMQLPWIDITLHFKTTLEQIVVCWQTSPPKSTRRPQLVASADFCDVNLFLMADFKLPCDVTKGRFRGRSSLLAPGLGEPDPSCHWINIFLLKISFSFFLSKLIHSKKSNRTEGFVMNSDSGLILSALNLLPRSYSELFLFVVLLVIIPLEI